MRVKICGITNYEDARLCCDSGADALGFIFCEKSKRYIRPKVAEKIIARLPAFIMKIGVFVNEKADTVNQISREINLTGVQLHGEESPEFTAQIFLPVIKAFRINEPFDFSILDGYNQCKFLFDAFISDDYGGTGISFNWDIIPYQIRKEIIIAGGVSSDNIESIYKKIKPEGVDLSSSLEISPGIKDEEKVKEFFEKINSLRRV